MCPNLSEVENLFELSDEQSEILSTADKWCRSNLYDLSAEMDNNESWPEHIFPMLGEAGYLGLTIPESYGGQGMPLLDAGLVCQAMGRWNPAITLSWGAHDNLCVNNIYRNGTEEQRQKYLPGLTNGSLVGALALTEPGAGSDALGSMSTRAVKDGDSYVLTGNKIFITNGPIADVVLLYAKTDPEAGARGISAFIIEKGMPGFSVAQKMEKMGLRGSQTGELVLEEVRVPAENLIGVENNGVAVVMSGLDLERAFLAAGTLGLADRCLELSLEHATSRKQFNTPIASFQSVRFMIADMWIGLQTAATYIYRVLAQSQEMERGGGGRGAIHAHSAASILYGAKIAMEVVDKAVQIHGGSGYLWEMEVNRLYRAAKLYEIGAGTTEIRKMIVSDEIIGDYLRRNG